MRLETGARVGPYEVKSQIGVGGMGEVYRARDSNLGRDVAIKVLPIALAQDAAYVSRFQREAQALAALNHPNIAAIYGLEQNAIVMELVEGETLAARISAGPMPLDEVLGIARQIADGLEAAHERGIVHRDLKPANVKITPAGVVKILDFGLAKAVEATMQATSANSPTLTVPATQAGIILGTAAYMSPEQARGKPVDKRADIWAFGVVLYEMLSGRQMFAGETISDSLAGVLKNPIEFETLPAETSPGVRKLLKGCLERDPRERLRDIGDARRELKAAEREEAAAVQPTGALRARRQWVPWAVAAACLIAAVTFAAAWYRRETPPPQVVRFSVAPPERMNFTNIPAVSPDGKWIAWTVGSGTAAGQLWIRAIDSLQARPVAGAEAVAQIFWSGNSRYVGFPVPRTAQLKKVAIDGGAAEVIATLPASAAGGAGNVGGGTWNRDGRIVFVSGGKLYEVAATGGTPKPLTLKSGTDIEYRWPHWLPDGRHFLVLAFGVRSGGLAEVRVINADSGEEKTITKSDSRVEFDSGHLLFAREGVLFAQAFDPDRLATAGEPVRIVESVDGNAGPRRADFSASSGVLVYRPEPEADRTFYWHDRAGKALQPLDPTLSRISHVEISPDGGRVAIDHPDDAGSGDIWVIELARGVRSRITTDPARDWVTAWSPDGRRIAFTTDRGRRSHQYQIWVAEANGSGQAQPLLVNDQNKHHMSWSPDGKHLVYEASSTGGGYDLWVLPLEGSAKPYPLLATEFSEGVPQFSHDGRWLAYVWDRSGRHEIHVREFPGGASADTVQVSTNGGVSPRWRKDGREICYLTENGEITAVPIQAAGGVVKPGAPVTLFRSELSGARMTAHFAMTDDGQRFLLPSRGEGVRSQPYIVVTNWLAGIRH